MEHQRTCSSCGVVSTQGVGQVPEGWGVMKLAVFVVGWVKPEHELVLCQTCYQRALNSFVKGVKAKDMAAEVRKGDRS